MMGEEDTKGIYILIMSIDMNISASIGALGPVGIEKGLYAYVGSAQNNLEKRVTRHLKQNGKRKFWHIDFLLDNEAVDVSWIFCREAERSEECKVAKELGRSNIPLKSFGSSDCRCVSHLLKIVDYSFLNEFALERECIIMKGKRCGESTLVSGDHWIAWQRQICCL